jgi:hypothetical protein
MGLGLGKEVGRMADLRIVCTIKGKYRPTSEHEHIVQVGTGSTAQRYTSLMSVAEVIDAIERGLHTFYTMDTKGHRAKVDVAKCSRCGHKIIRTAPDPYTENNLDNLPRCRT